MNRRTILTRVSVGRPMAATALGLLGAMTLPAWAGNPTLAELAAQVAALQNTVSSQATQIAQLQKSVNPLATVLTYDPTRKLVQLTGVNLQIVNGMGTTTTTNGVGNLIIGYNEDDGNARGTCTVSVSAYDSFEPDCTGDGGTFTRTLSGSHNLVIGAGHGYSSFAGMVVGQDNLITARFAVVSSGDDNTASGDYSAVSGGVSNTASGIQSSVSGGEANTASGGGSSVSGGGSNLAGFGDASVSGGTFNSATSFGSSVSGGYKISAGGNPSNGWAAGGNGTPAFHSP